MLNSKFRSGFAGCLLSIALLAWPPGPRFAAEGYSENPGTEGNGDFTIGPEYKIDPDLTDRGNPKGKYFEFSMPLADSKIFRGDDATLDPKKPVRKERKIFVYVPAAYKDGTKAPILVTLDGPSRLEPGAQCARQSDDFQGPEPQAAGVHRDRRRKRRQRQQGERARPGIRHDVRPLRPLHQRRSVAGGAEQCGDQSRVSATSPSRRIPGAKPSMGCSSGGAAALTMGWFRPDLFRRLITYSGTFVDQQDDDAPEEAKYPLGAWEYHSSMKLIENSEKKPLRIFTHVSENDNRANDPEETYHNWVMANERTAAALKAKGYDYRFVFSRATRHCDGKVFEQTLADTLVWMWRGYHAE